MKWHQNKFSASPCLSTSLPESPTALSFSIAFLPSMCICWGSVCSLLSIHVQYRKCIYAKSLHSCMTLCDPMDCSSLGSSAHGVLQARILEWVAMPSSSGSSRPRVRTHVSFISCIGRRTLYHLRHLGSPNLVNASGLIPCGCGAGTFPS